MQTYNLWWECPKCKNKVTFGAELASLFCEEDNEAYFCPKNGVPFYLITCYNNECDASWNFGISGMHKD